LRCITVSSREDHRQIRDFPVIRENYISVLFKSAGVEFIDENGCTSQAGQAAQINPSGRVGTLASCGTLKSFDIANAVGLHDVFISSMDCGNFGRQRGGPGDVRHALCGAVDCAGSYWTSR
jgi:hypothetical protein